MNFFKAKNRYLGKKNIGSLEIALFIRILAYRELSSDGSNKIKCCSLLFPPMIKLFPVNTTYLYFTYYTNFQIFLLFFQPVSELRSEFSEDIHSSADNLMSSMLDGLVRHDRLLTDSLNLGVAHLATSPMTGNGNMTTSENHQIISQISQLPVKTEHSYSMAGSDGDSIPDSPLSLHDTGNTIL